MSDRVVQVRAGRRPGEPQFAAAKLSSDAGAQIVVFVSAARSRPAAHRRQGAHMPEQEPLARRPDGAIEIEIDGAHASAEIIWRIIYVGVKIVSDDPHIDFLIVQIIWPGYFFSIASVCDSHIQSIRLVEPH